MGTFGHLTQEQDDPRTLVVVFLRGAADGLTLVAPIADDDYQRLRPRLAVKASEAVPLDGTFGLHPKLAALGAAWKDGDLAIAHGAGGESDTRSHFEAQDLMEHGGPVAGGWLARFLRARGPVQSPLAAVALAPTLPASLSGAPSAAAFTSLDEFSLMEGSVELPNFPAQLRRLYEAEGPTMRAAAANTFEALRRIESIDRKASPEHGAEYDPDDSFARGLRQIALLIKAKVGLDAASVDLGGWDSHFTQQTLLEPLMSRLGNGLAAFRQDLGPRMATTTVVVMTEFGRRVGENTAFGTDHGCGSAMFVLGGDIKGGQVLGGWPGLHPETLEGPGDLPVWNNYRNILAPILARHGTPDSLKEIFPDFNLNPVSL
ncbi:MAG: DUF1501 domain-containing protein [Verrucomicrobia bacterium]|nr:DUF1501 domain-containing protein [Verrucomicrobiota bacterium]MDA1006524.1 DUF1501 domain-containing protein [Verrucomicrobiota bacterium]